MRERIRAGMAAPSVRAKLTKLNRRKRAACSDDCKSKKSDALLGMRPANHSSVVRSQAGWLSIGGRRYYMMSTWERNYARLLQWLLDQGEIRDWDYEPLRFEFSGVRYGNRTYTPDFLVVEKTGEVRWVEIKGWMNAASAVKLKRMSKYFPDQAIDIVDRARYKALTKQLSGLIPGWERPGKW
jgi:hypothetical protein